MAASSSGTYGWVPTAGELILYAFAEAGVKRAEIETEHLVNARMASNLIFSDWSNDEPHLWQVDLLSIPLVQGVATYQLPGNTVLALDTYLRTFSLPNIFNVTPNFTTVTSIANVLVGLTNHGLQAGNWVNIVVPISVGGLILLGYYQVATVPNGNQFTIIAASSATGFASDTGVTPKFTTSVLSGPGVTVTFPNHGLLSGFTWNVPVATQCGGITIQGAYTVQSVIDANNFTITATQSASGPLFGTETAFENGGLAQIAAQSATVEPIDRITWPIGRSEYASYPNKTFQSPPTVNWFDRLVSPQITLYPTPDGAGPYALQIYRVRQGQDVNGTFAETVDVPYRFIAAYQAELSVRLAVLYGPDRLQMLEARRDRFLGRAQTQDTEHVPIYISPSISSYGRR